MRRAEHKEPIRPLLELALRPEAERLARAGGKGEGLMRLVSAGLPVPETWLLEASWFREAGKAHLPAGHDPASLLRSSSGRGGLERAARARERLLAAPLAHPLAAALEALAERLAPSAPWGLAVRSSATAEDGEDGSMAGLATSVLGVRGGTALAAAVREVWASCLLPRALHYLSHAGRRDVAMAVLIQRVIPAEAAGVLYTAPPAGATGPAWDEGDVLVNATWGLGAPVVEGAATPDVFRVARRGGGIVETLLAEKRLALEVGPAGLVTRDVRPERAREPSVEPATLRVLASMAERLHGVEPGAPLDLEFVVERAGGVPRIWLLQARAALGEPLPEGGGATTLWTRANVGEALPGAATPLTWSVARAFSEEGFRRSFAALGCRVPRGATLVANVHGRFYLNLSALADALGELPGLSPRRLLELGGGVDEVAIAALERSRAATRRPFGARLATPLVVARALARQAGLEARVASHQVASERARRALAEIDLGILPDDALATTLRRARAHLDVAGGLMLPCAAAALASHVALTLALERLLPHGRADLVARTLAGAMRDVDSAEPGLAVARAARVVAGDPLGRAAILGGARTPEELPPGPARGALFDLLARFGDRAVREAELATPRWSEDPAPLLAMVASALRADPSEADLRASRARALADRELAALEEHLSPLALALIRALVSRAQKHARLRERMRTRVSAALTTVRRVVLEIDRRLRRRDPALPADAAFYCTDVELVAALGTGHVELGKIIRVRHAEHLRDRARPDPPATFVGRPPSPVLPPAGGPVLRGLGASAGVVEGPSRVLAPGQQDLDLVRPGEILVCRTTDVGLSPLFLVAAGVVTELGGPLSHAAIIAREYGVPAVVNVTGAFLAIKTGERLRIDGGRGTVERLDELPPSSLRSGAPPRPRHELSR